MTLAYMLPSPSTVRSTRTVDSSGVVRNAVKVKPSPEDPEQPYAGARVALLRLDTMQLVWRGMSDETGEYIARGLVRGQRLIPVAVDPSQTYECVASGPVIARGADDA